MITFRLLQQHKKLKITSISPRLPTAPDSTMSIDRSPASLGGLPDELLIQILGDLSAPDLSAICLVNQKLNKLADPILHKSVAFDHPRHHVSFSESLARRPRRGSLIQEVRLEYPSTELSEVMAIPESPHPLKFDHFSHTISTMSNLENLEVSVPEALSHGIGNLFNGPFDLACLKTCKSYHVRILHLLTFAGTLYYQREDGGYWDLQENIHIFSHPTLEVLIIRRAKLDTRGFDSLEKPENTALKELHLLECDINDDALSDILLHPEALQIITITQVAEPSPELEESPLDIGDYILALSSANHSLVTITIDFPTLVAKHALRLREFSALKSLTLRDYQLIGQGHPRLHSVGLPPVLEKLNLLGRIGEDEEIAELLCYTLEHTLARQQCQIVVSEKDHVIPAELVEACKKSEYFHLQVD